ncbi:MAG: hypothetical protein R2741_09190 [Methanolobus sp.]
MVLYPEHSPSPRNAMGAAMVKQCIGVSTSNTKLRPDTYTPFALPTACNGKKAQTCESIHFDDRPAGQNFVVAVACPAKDTV